MKIGVLTGGGDCPGLNAVIRAVVRRSSSFGYEVLGIQQGWLGLVEGSVIPLTNYSVTGILTRGGTIIGTARKNPLKTEEDKQKLIDNYKSFGLDALIAIGGEDTLGVAAKLHAMGFKIVGVPKTIDNDIPFTDYTFGFDTAVSIATEAIDRLHSTAEAHRRVMVVEVMGRHAGWIATVAGIAGGADNILIPEIPFDIEEVCRSISNRIKKGKAFSLLVVAEGAKPKDGSLVAQESSVDDFGHIRLGGISYHIAREIEKRTGIETRVAVLGHIQRGGTPTAFDRVLATRYGIAAVDLIKNNEFGRMVTFSDNQISSVMLSDIIGKQKNIDMKLYDVAKVFFG